MSVFTKKSHQHEPVKRNTFDLTFNNHLTMDLGKLYPVFCKEVLPTDSFRIKPSFGLRLDPTVFPLQSKLRADLHFFYVRNRNLWDNWQDYITAQLSSDHTFPYLAQSADFFKTGSLADYLGIPTTIVGDYQNSLVSYCPTDLSNLVTQGALPAGTADDVFFQTFGILPTSMRLPWHIGLKYAKTGSTGVNCLAMGPQYILTSDAMQSIPGIEHDDDYVGFTYYTYLTHPLAAFSPNTTASSVPYYAFNLNSNGVVNTLGTSISSYSVNSSFFVFSNPDGVSGDNGVLPSSIFCGCVNFQYAAGKIMLDQSRYNFLNSIITSSISKFGSCFIVLSLPYGALNMNSPTSFNVADKADISFIPYLTFPLEGTFPNELAQRDSASNPFLNGELPLSALPCRAYNAIYNSFYRDQQNDPLILDGEIKRNVYCENTADGADGTDYHLYRRRWEADQFISAMQSPQQGIAPLVGLVSHPTTGTADLQFQSSDPDTPDSVDKITVSYDVASGSITGITSVDGANHATLINVMDSISTGISINDLRNVNALQRWLERNIHLGFRYKEQLESHFGKSPSFEVLDMPEFIGGCSAVMDMQTIRQTAPTDGASLGDYAGFGELLTQGKHDITKYCDEHGFILGILSITPVPSYSQTLPKFFTKTHNHLDYFFPEFAHLGYQPIPYAELCPLQKVGSVNDTFGYQHAWYDYQSSLDEIHGLFRSSLQDYVLSRVFNTAPSLTNTDFLYVDEACLNNPFPVTQTDSHHIKGLVHFDVSAKRPISKFGMPSLE